MKFICFPEQVGGTLIPDGPLSPGDGLRHRPSAQDNFDARGGKPIFHNEVPTDAPAAEPTKSEPTGT